MPDRTRRSEYARKRRAPWMTRQAGASCRLPGAGWWLCLTVLIAAVGCHGQPATRPASAASPQRIYAQHCLGCHGASGEGLYGPNIQGFNRSIAQIVDVIANGRGKMPGFEGDLSEAKMRQVADYVKIFKYRP